MNFLPAVTAIRRRILSGVVGRRQLSSLSANWSHQLSFASPESDFQATSGGGSGGEGGRIWSSRGANDAAAPLWSYELCFASPESDFSAQQIRTVVTATQTTQTKAEHHEEEEEEYWSHQLSFASPESDFTSSAIQLPLAEEESVAVPTSGAEAWWSGALSFASPESDFCASFAPPSSQEQEVRLPQSFAEALQREDAAVLVTTASRPHLVVHVNRAWQDLCGYEPNEAWHQRPDALLQGPRSNRSLAHETVATVLSTHQPADMYQVNRDKAGREFVNHVTMGPLLRWNDDGPAAEEGGGVPPPLLVAILERVTPDQVPLRLIRSSGP